MFFIDSSFIVYNWHSGHQLINTFELSCLIKRGSAGTKPRQIKAFTLLHCVFFFFIAREINIPDNHAKWEVDQIRASLKCHCREEAMCKSCLCPPLYFIWG